MLLKSLEIKNFRSLEDLKVSKLGRVNLIVGKNNSGKSSVLEALRIYAGNSQRSLLEDIAASHDEKFRIRESELSSTEIQYPFEDFFSGRQFPIGEGPGISIGEIDGGPEVLRIEHGFLEIIEETLLDSVGTQESAIRLKRQRIPKLVAEKNETGDIHPALFIGKNDRWSQILLDILSPRSRPSIEHLDTIACSVIPTQFVSVDELADEWDKIVFTEFQEIVKKGLQIISPEFEDLVFVKSEYPGYVKREFSRSAKVKLSGTSRPVPLNSLGDGVLRVLQLLLKVFPAKDGFLLIDEFENGLHFGVQEKVWALLFEIAEKLNIQIFATTHSWDCIESFSKTACEFKNSEGILFRVGKSVKESNYGAVIATVFDEKSLHNITQAEVEVR